MATQSPQETKKAREAWKYVDEYLCAIDTVDEDLIDRMDTLRKFFDTRGPRQFKRNEGGKFR